MPQVNQNISYCIGQIDQITRDLDEIADQLSSVTSGIQISRLQEDLRCCADSYRRVKEKLQRIHQ